MSKILVIGANGTVGTELVKLLNNSGEQVLAATSKKEAGPGQVHFNVQTKEGLENAFKDVSKLYLMSPPGFTNQDELLIPLIDEAKKRGLKKVVLMTAMGANADENSPFRKTEVALEKSGLTYNIIRPNWFMQNFNTFWIQGINSQNKIFLPVGKAKGSFIDARDIALTAFTLLKTNKFDNQDFDLTGPRALDHDEVAKILSNVSGRSIGYQEISPEEMYDGLRGAGVPENYAKFLIVILEYFKLGYAERTTDNVALITGIKPRSIETYAQDYKHSWIK